MRGLHQSYEGQEGLLYVKVVFTATEREMAFHHGCQERNDEEAVKAVKGVIGRCYRSVSE